MCVFWPLATSCPSPSALEVPRDQALWACYCMPSKASPFASSTCYRNVSCKAGLASKLSSASTNCGKRRVRSRQRLGPGRLRGTCSDRCSECHCIGLSVGKKPPAQLPQLTCSDLFGLSHEIHSIIWACCFAARLAELNRYLGGGGGGGRHVLGSGYVLGVCYGVCFGGTLGGYVSRVCMPFLNAGLPKNEQTHVVAR